MEPSRHPYGPDPAQYGELWLPAGALPADPQAGTVVIIHGGFWRARFDLSLGRPLAADLAARGYAVWNLEYRRAGAGGGWPATFEDVAAGIDMLADLPVDTSRLVAVGHSAGGHLAVWAAGRAGLPRGALGAPKPPSTLGAPGVRSTPGTPGSTPGERPPVTLAAVVSQAGVLTLADCARDGTGGTAALDLMGGGPAELPAEYRLADPVAAVPIETAVLCLHSRADDNVPFRYSERYVAAAAAAGGKAVLRETTGDHFTLIDPASPDWGLVTSALPRLLDGEPC